ncbi:MAG: hypothetical protein PHN51_10890 [Candidatus Nanopelagicales bacterium]|nr:hypothetical protein [Candidatus Nanopelagicales bacterium]
MHAGLEEALIQAQGDEGSPKRGTSDGKNYLAHAATAVKRSRSSPHIWTAALTPAAPRGDMK